MPRRIGDYLIEDELLGRGRYGQVYKGKNEKTGQVIAAKMISNKRIDGAISSYIRREIANMQSIKHENVVRLYDVKKGMNNTYIMIEYCSGGTLESYLSKKGPIPEELLKAWSIQLVDAFRMLRENNIIHRDIKTANILLSDESESAQIKLTDFGFSKLLSETSLAGTFCGTPVFMAPEVLRHAKYSFAADIWSMGVVIYTLLVNANPFKCFSMRDLQELQTHEIQFPADRQFSPEVQDFIRKMVVYDPNQRITIHELAQHPFLRECTISLQNPIGHARSLGILNQDAPSIDPERESRMQQISDVCMNIEQMCGDIEDFFAMYEDMILREAHFAALGFANYCHLKGCELIEYNDQAKEKLNIIESTHERFSELYENSQMLLIKSNENIEGMKRYFGEEYNHIVNGYRVAEDFLGDITDFLTYQMTEQNQIDKLRYNLKILTVILLLNPTNQAAQQKYKETNKLIERISRGN